MEKDYTSVNFYKPKHGLPRYNWEDSINLHKLLKATNMDKSSIAYCIEKLSACCIQCTRIRPGLIQLCFCGKVF